MDYGQSRDFQVHQILGKANIWGLENLANLEMLTESGELGQIPEMHAELLFHLKEPPTFLLKATPFMPWS